MVLGGAQIKVNKISFIHRCDRYPVITLDANNKMSIVPIKGGNNATIMAMWQQIVCLYRFEWCLLWCHVPQCPAEFLTRGHKACRTFDAYTSLRCHFSLLAFSLKIWEEKNYQKRKCNLVRPNKPTGWFQGLVFHIQKSCLNFSIPTSSMEKSAISLPNNGTLDVDQPILASNNLDSL